MGLRLLLRSDHLVSDAVIFFVVRHLNREILHVAVTPCPTAEWMAQQIIECCAWDRWPPRFLIHDRDSRYAVLRSRGSGGRIISDNILGHFELYAWPPVVHESSSRATTSPKAVDVGARLKQMWR